MSLRSSEGKTISNHLSNMKKEDVRELVRQVKEIKQKEDLSKNQKIAIERKIYLTLIEKENKCKRCAKQENLTLDHIIPSFILQMFGIDTQIEIIEDNYQILCKMCNGFKTNRLDFSIPETKEVLLKLLKSI